MRDSEITQTVEPSGCVREHFSDLLAGSHGIGHHTKMFPRDYRADMETSYLGRDRRVLQSSPFTELRVKMFYDEGFGVGGSSVKDRTSERPSKLTLENQRLRHHLDRP